MYLLTALAAWKLYPLPYGPQLPIDSNDYYRDIQTITVGLLSAQATLIGLVFPIVIALVSLLTDGRVTNQGRLQLFLSETEATFVGISGLSFLIAISAQLLMFSQVPDRVGAAITAINIIWFGFNVVTIGFFLFQTLRYVQPSQRFEIQKKYSANVVWKYQLAEIIRDNRWANAIHYGYLPDPKSSLENTTTYPIISPLRMHGEADHKYTVRTRADHRLKDVKLGLLAFVVTQWLVRYSRQSNPSRFCWLEFVARPFQPVEADQTLLQVVSGPGLSRLEQTLLRFAFSFEKVTPKPPVADVFHFMEELVSDLLVLADGDRTREFEVLLENLTDYHAFLFQIAESRDNDGEFSYAQFEQMFGRTASQKWAFGYRKLMKKVASRIAVDSDAFRSLAWSFPRFIARTKAERFHPVGQSALLLSRMLMRELIEWASDQHRSASGEASNPNALFRLPTSSDIQYAEAWRIFIGTWEHYVTVWKSEIKDSDTTWKDLSAQNEQFREHLFHSIELVGLAASNGDMTAVLWSTDLLLKWKSHARLDVPNHLYLNDLYTIHYSLPDFGKPWTELQENAASGHPNFSERTWGAEISPYAVWNAIFANLFDDCRAVLMVVLINWTRTFGESGTGLMACKRILNGTVHDLGWHGASEDVDLSFDGLMISFLRIVASEQQITTDSYSAWLSKLTRSLSNISRESYVSSRIYSGHQSDDISSFLIETCVLLAGRVPGGERRSGHSISTFIASQPDDERRRSIRFYLERLQTTIDQGVLNSCASLIVALRREAAPEEAPIYVAKLREFIARSLEELDRISTSELSDAEIDPNRLREIARAASQEAFQPERSGFPIALFSEVDFTNLHLERFTLNATNQNKGEYTRPLMSDPVSNESSFWADAMKRQVAVVILSDVLRKSDFQTIIAPTAEAFWEALQRAEEALRSEGLKPILIVPGSSEPSWLFDWSWKTNPEVWRPKNLRVWRKEDMPDGYLFNLNDTEVFGDMVRPGRCYVIAREQFERVRFTNFQNVPVFVEFDQDTSDAWKGTLKLAFEREVQVAGTLGFTLEYEQDQVHDEN